jgi:predicted nucleic acid-binding protein
MADTYQRQLTAFPNLRLVPADAAICRTAARLRAAQRSLRLPDAIHLATALEQGATAFVTNDRDLRPPPGLEVIRISTLT